MNLFIIIFIAITCRCLSQEITNKNNVASFSFLSDLKKLFPAKGVKQVQYEVDLNSGCLWVHTLILQPESGNFLITVYKNSTESIVAFEKGEIINPEDFFIGYAFVNGVAYQSNILSGKWEPAEMNDVLRKLKRFNYFTINTCADYQDSLSILNHNSTIIPKENNHSGAKPLTNGIENIEYNSDNYKVIISKLSNDFITKWSVSNHSVLIRLITNEVILKSEIILPIIS
ncbi:MAG: hypothetical protein NTW91_10790, partial [Verrucomicrobia bacterium]|nr:hypothetical protein [Verrucomicrobiota bacterium]